MAEGLIAVGKVLLAVAIGLPLAIYFLQDRLLFNPQPLGEQQRAAVKKRFPAVREIFLPADADTNLHAWHVPGTSGAPLILYFGGNAEDVSWMVEEAETRLPGTAWLLISYRGYGGSGGSPSEAAISADALQWYDYAVTQLRPTEIIAFGRSLGTGAAVLLASERNISKVVLVTPFDSMVEVARHHYPFLPVGLMLRHRFDSVSLAPKIAAPLLCIAAARDEVIPSAHARKLYDAWGGEKRWMELEGAGHNSTDGIPAFWQGIAAFLQKY